MLGGGTFTAQNKVLPGSYMNFVSAANAGNLDGASGVVAIALDLNWGPKDTLMEIGMDTLENGLRELIGYDYTDDNAKVIREIMRHASRVYLYRLNGNGVNASCTFGTAKYAGTRGNDIKVVISANADDSDTFDVITCLGTEVVDRQIAVASAAALEDNAYIVWNDSSTLAVTTGTSCQNGTNSTAAGSDHSAFLSAIECEAFNVLCSTSQDSSVEALYAAFTRRMIEQAGVKIQTVLYNYVGDYDGIINVVDSANLVPWVSGA